MQNRPCVDIAQRLVRFNTVNPPGDEEQVAAYLGRVLEDAGFTVKLYSFAKGRTSIVAESLRGDDDRPPICFTGHLDTVGLGAASWSFDAHGGETANGVLYGRGSTDMKGGIGAMVAAAIDMPGLRRSSVKLILTAGEETGCEGALHLKDVRALGSARAIVVGEPTSNAPCFGHRGALWLNLSIKGRAAHGSTPLLGDNALVKAAAAITRLHCLAFPDEPHHHLGPPTLNVGYCHSGTLVNIVPDLAEIGIDIRTTPQMDMIDVRKMVSGLANGAELKCLLDLAPVYTCPDHEWFIRVCDAAKTICKTDVAPAPAPYFTDASILAPALNTPPTVILGPGDASLAHCVDESCSIQRIEEAEAIYRELMQ